MFGQSPWAYKIRKAKAAVRVLIWTTVQVRRRWVGQCRLEGGTEKKAVGQGWLMGNAKGSR